MEVCKIGVGLMGLVRRKKAIFLLLLIGISINVNGQNNDLERALKTINKIGATYDSKLDNVKFSIESSYHYACSDSVILGQKFDYLVRKGEYYIEFEEFEILLLDDFFLRVDHQNKEVVYCKKPLLEHNDPSHRQGINALRENVLQSSLIQFDTLSNQLKITVIIPQERAEQFNKVELYYTSDYSFKKIVYYEKEIAGGGLFQMPNCLKINYTNENFHKVAKDPFSRNNYLTKKGDTYYLTPPYQNYVLTEQILPDE